MDPTLFLVLVVVALVLVAGIAAASRRRRDASLEPTRLGPTWAPPGDEGNPPPADAGLDDGDLAELANETGVDRRTVETVVRSWREYLAVLGLHRLPPTHAYRLYDPYNPPVARRDADGRPTPDRDRVARDIGSRTDVDERDARAVLQAVRFPEPSDTPI